MVALIENDRVNDAELVRLIKDGRILIGDYGVPSAPTGLAWDPGADLVSGDRVDLGYYSDTGFNLTPEPGDNTQIKAHNKDVVIDENDPGTWAAAFSSIQQGRTQAEMYFDASINGTTGEMTVSSAAVNTFRDLCLVGYSADDDLILIHAPRVKVGDREAMNFNATDPNAYGMTLRFYKDPVAGYMFKAWRTKWIDSTPSAPTISSASPATESPGMGNVLITGTNFGGASAVKFGTEDAVQFWILSATQILAIMPSGTAGSKNITVTTPGGTTSGFTYARS